MTRKGKAAAGHGGAMVDVVSRTGVIVACEAAQEERLGFGPGELAGVPFEKVYALLSRRKIIDALSGEAGTLSLATLNLRERAGEGFAVSAVIERFDDDGHGACVRIHKWPLSPALAEAEQLNEDNQMLQDIVAASDDPGWCIEFVEPVDLSAPEQEAIRQMFENRRRWRFCNAAMGRFYRLPEGEDLNDRPVDEVFPYNAENESFARELIKGSFDVVGCPSLDTRYDGVKVPVENDVRGLIRDNMLFRMWGTVRDVSKHIRRQEALQQSIGALEAMLAAVPDPFLVVDAESGIILRANLAAEALFGRTIERLENDAFDTLVGERLKFDRLAELASGGDPGKPPAPVVGHVRSANGPAIVEATACLYQYKTMSALAVSMRNARVAPAEAEDAPLERARGR